MNPSGTKPSATGDMDVRAESYADRATPMTALTEPFARDLLHAIAPTLELPTTRLVLDVGCGGGAFALAYLARYPRGIAGQTVLCTDISPGMVAIAESVILRHIAHAECLTRFEFAVEDATTLQQVDDGSVQALVSVFSVYTVEDSDKVFAQIRRVLASGVASVFATTVWTELPKQLSEDGRNFGIEMQAAAMAAIKICYPEESDEKHEEKDGTSDGNNEAAVDPSAQWGDPEGVKQLVAGGGLCDVRVWRSIHTQCTGDREGLWAMVTAAILELDLSSKTASEISGMKQKYFEAIANPDHAAEDAVFLISAANVVSARLGV